MPAQQTPTACVNCDTLRLRTGETVLIRRTPDGERRQTIHILRQNSPGWLGVVFSSAMVIDSSRGQPMLRFQDYPRIETIEPGSPAARGGLVAGDRLLALDGRDVRQGAEPLDRLLVPGRTLVVRVTRDGETRDVPVTVAPRPSVIAYGSGGASRPGRTPTHIEIVRGAAPTGVTLAPSASGGGRTPAIAPPSPLHPGVATATSMVNPGTFAMAGMELTTVNAGLAEYFGVRSGVLVIRVAPNGPASRSGLRDGDVIIAADGTPVANRGTLVGALIEAESRRALKLDIVRMKVAQAITLRW